MLGKTPFFIAALVLLGCHSAAGAPVPASVGDASRAAETQTAEVLILKDLVDRLGKPAQPPPESPSTEEPPPQTIDCRPIRGRPRPHPACRMV